MGKATVVITHNGSLLHHKNNAILPFVTTWRDLEGVMLSEISHRRKASTTLFTYMSTLNNQHTNKMKQNHGHRENRSVFAEGQGGGEVSERDREVQTCG